MMEYFIISLYSSPSMFHTFPLSPSHGIPCIKFFLSLILIMNFFSFNFPILWNILILGGKIIWWHKTAEHTHTFSKVVTALEYQRLLARCRRELLSAKALIPFIQDIDTLFDNTCKQSSSESHINSGDFTFPYHYHNSRWLYSCPINTKPRSHPSV